MSLRHVPNFVRNSYVYVCVFYFIILCIIDHLLDSLVFTTVFFASIQAEPEQKTWLDSMEPSEPAEPSFSSLLPAPKVSSWPVDPSWVLATQIFFYFHPEIWGRWPEIWGRWTHFDEYFSKWFETTNYIASYFQLVGCTPTDIPLWEIPKRSAI